MIGSNPSFPWREWKQPCATPDILATTCSGAKDSIAPGLAGLAREGPVTVAWPREVVGRNVELVGACKTPHWDRAEPREPTMGD